MAKHYEISSALPVIGENVDRYTILELLGRGSMGVVFSAIDQVLEREVAIKFLDPGKFASPDVAAIVLPEMKQRFVREARTVAMVSHPNAVQVLGAELNRDIPYIVMELIDGKPLSLVFERAGQLSVAETCNLGSQIADVLAYAWEEHRIIHRDLKPGNVMMVADGRCKLMDFGLAKVIEAGSSFPSITKSGITMGSVLYKSPEQHRGEPDLDFRSDIFSLGILLYRAMAGIVPFPGDDEVTVYEKKCAGLEIPVVEVIPGIPEAMAALVEQMLAEEPEDRPDSYEVVTTLLGSMVSKTRMLSVHEEEELTGRTGSGGIQQRQKEALDQRLPAELDVVSGAEGLTATGGRGEPVDEMLGKTTITRPDWGDAVPGRPEQKLEAETLLEEPVPARGEVVFLPELQWVIEAAQAGAMFGVYQVDEMIGCGGMGAVFSGTDTQTGESVALKFLFPAAGRGMVEAEELVKEADVIRGLDHNAIVKVREFNCTNRLEFMVMDLFLGPEGFPVNLMDYATSFGDGNGLLDEEDACQIMLALLDAIGYAHEHGVVHCDLKPENVLFQFGGYEGGEYWEAELKLTDFGLAKVIGEELVLDSVSKSLSAFRGDEETLPPDAAALIGTFEYMSPEQRRGEAATPLSDLFSVGIMVLRLLTGARELGLRNRPTQLRPGISRLWDAFILKALRERPEDRYADAAEMSARLREIQSTLGQ